MGNVGFILRLRLLSLRSGGFLLPGPEWWASEVLSGILQGHSLGALHWLLDYKTDVFYFELSPSIFGWKKLSFWDVRKTPGVFTCFHLIISKSHVLGSCFSGLGRLSGLWSPGSGGRSPCPSGSTCCSGSCCMGKAICCGKICCAQARGSAPRVLKNFEMWCSSMWRTKMGLLLLFSHVRHVN